MYSTAARATAFFNSSWVMEVSSPYGGCAANRQSKNGRNPAAACCTWPSAAKCAHYTEKWVYLCLANCLHCGSFFSDSSAQVTCKRNFLYVLTFYTNATISHIL